MRPGFVYKLFLVMVSVCNATKMNCEIAGRTIAIPTDVWLALVNMGLDVEKLPDYMNTIYNGGTLIIPPRKFLGLQIFVLYTYS